MAKIAISLPDDVLQAVEKERELTGESQSEFFRRAANALLQQKLREEQDLEYTRAYRRCPRLMKSLQVYVRQAWKPWPNYLGMTVTIREKGRSVVGGPSSAR